MESRKILERWAMHTLPGTDPARVNWIQEEGFRRICGITSRGSSAIVEVLKEHNRSGKTFEYTQVNREQARKRKRGSHGTTIRRKGGLGDKDDDEVT